MSASGFVPAGGKGVGRIWSVSTRTVGGADAGLLTGSTQVNPDSME